MPEIGQILGGRYRLTGDLGEGGMASIFRAHDEQLDRDVAVKVLRPDYGRDAGFVTRFRQEAQAAASLSHANVVSVYDFGTDAAGPYIVMELVDGQDLESILQERGVLPPMASARIALGVAEALAAAHAHGIVHRDVKPSNVLVTKGGHVKVVDFGIARALSDAQLTLPGTTLGSVHYFSPEQARGEAVTASSDVYSLGLVLFEMLTGRRPFGGDSAAAVAMARLASAAPRPSSVRPDVPPALDAIVARALAPDPAGRFPSATALAEALERFLAGDPQPAPAAAAAAGAAGVAAGLAAGVRPGPARGIGRAPALPPPPPPEEPLDEDGRPSNAWAWAAGILGLLILVAAAVLAFLALQNLGGPGPSPSGGSVAVPQLVDLPLD
ncbi:MAG TPA: protein kinase, partial [Candidatus Limnocylindrales bacterium]|nr:protein kinase [Candidatus Limnocylindrales bacterium]